MAGDTLTQLDPLYFLDYALFTGAVRHYASRILEEAFKADPNPVRRRLHLVNVVKEEYAAYEDVGAILNALLDYRRGNVAVPFASLMAFKPGDVELSTMFQGQKVTSGDELYVALGIDEWVPRPWTEWFPHLDLRKALRLACKFFFEDCVQNQKRYGVIAYNKVKHGLTLVPSGHAYRDNLPDYPAAIFSTPAEQQKEGKPPYIVYGFPSEDGQIEQRHASIEFIQCNLRLLTALYVVWRYPEVWRARGFNDAKGLFGSDEFSDVRHLVGEVTAKK